MQQTNSTYPFYGPEDIKRYLSGSMSAQEMHDMEKAALKDPLLADAIDGFRNADPAITDTHLNAIKASILGLSQQESVVVPLNSTPKTQWWRWVAAACSLTLIAGTTWWMMQKAEPGVQPVAVIDQNQAADTMRTAITSPSAAPAQEAAEPEQAAVAPNNAELKKEKAVSTKVPVPAPAKALEASIARKVVEDQTIQSKNERPLYESITLKRKQVNNDYAAAIMSAPAASAAPMAKNSNPLPDKANRMFGFQPVAYIEGLVVDKEGTPLPNASISIPGRNNTTANNDGSFVLPVYDSSFGVSVNMVGYQNATAYLKPGKQNKVVLEKAFNNMDETVVIGYGTKRKKTFAYMEDARKAQAAAVSASEVIYPEEGWSHFYEELGTSLGVNKAPKTKTLQIKFTVDDNGDPVDFEVVESPDAIMAKKAIEFIKKAKWKNFKLDKNALVKIEVN